MLYLIDVEQRQQLIYFLVFGAGFFRPSGLPSRRLVTF
jgi:hypothetical protein